MEPAARKQKILSAIVESFIRSGEPVGSKSLLDETGLKVSSATVRNDMADLTEQGRAAAISATRFPKTPIRPKAFYREPPTFCQA